MPQKAKLLISRKVWADIFYLHKKCSNTEWSGILWLDTEGGVEDISNLKLTAIDFSLRDIGSPDYTEYDFGVDIFDIYDAKPELFGKKMGLLHTHHSMSTFMSGTDLDTLKEQAPYHNYFVSLIVNIKGDLVCKISIEGLKKYKTLIKNDQGEYIGVSGVEEEKVVFTYNVDIEIENDLDADIEKYQAVKSLRVVETKSYSHSRFSAENYKPGEGFSKWQKEWNDTKEEPFDRQLTLFKGIHEENPLINNFEDKKIKVKTEIFLSKLITINNNWSLGLELAYNEVNQQLLRISKDKYIENVEENIDFIFGEVFDEEMEKYYELGIDDGDEFYTVLTHDIVEEARFILKEDFKYKEDIIEILNGL